MKVRVLFQNGGFKIFPPEAREQFANFCTNNAGLEGYMLFNTGGSYVNDKGITENENVLKGCFNCVTCDPSMFNCVSSTEYKNKPREQFKAKDNRTTDWSKTDELGNKIQCTDGNLTIQINGEDKIRHIGFIEAGVYYKGIPTSLHRGHKFTKKDSYGINYDVVQRVDKVVLNTYEGCFEILTETIKNKDIMFFKKQGFELQYIVPKSKMKSIDYKSIKINRKIT
jgi:hypothetical protein